MRLSRPAAVAIVALTSLSLATGAAAAQRQPAPSAEATPGTARRSRPSLQMDADETRRALEEVLKQYPPSLPRVLRMDPTLLNNDAYLQPTRSLRRFLNQHPEVAHNPNFFFAQYGDEQQLLPGDAAGPRHQHVARAPSRALQLERSSSRSRRAWSG